MARGILTWTVTLALLIGSGALAVHQLLPLLPCRQPIRYSIGEIDARFGISHDEFVSAVREAGEAWSAEAGKPLFMEVSDGGMVVNAVYDYRHEAQAKMAELGIKVDETRRSYDELRAKHASLEALFAKREQEYKTLKATFEAKKAAYEQESAAAESRGVSQEDAARLEKMREDVNAMVDDINDRGEALGTLIDELNAVVTVINSLGQKTNDTIDEYNEAGGVLEDEFDAALYTRNVSGQKIDVFTFSDRDELKRLLMHEMGHALGIQHLQASGAVMYYLNQSKVPTLTPADTAALVERCGL